MPQDAGRPMESLINPAVRWAIHPASLGTILHIDGLGDPPEPLPFEGDIISRPFLVDPQTKKPAPVRVVEIRKMFEKDRHILAVVVTRSDRDH